MWRKRLAQNTGSFQMTIGATSGRLLRKELFAERKTWSACGVPCFRSRDGRVKIYGLGRSRMRPEAGVFGVCLQ
jgi:hypothetical protein